MKKIEKTISRDLALIDIYAWHLGYTRGMKKWLGWSYSDSVFYIHDGVTDIMRPPHEHLTLFRDKIFKKIDSDRGWLKAEYKKFIDLNDRYVNFYSSSLSSLSKKTSPQDILDIYKQYSEYIERIVGPFITFFWLPVWLEKDREKAKQYKKEIALSISARKKTDHIFPQGAVLIDKILIIVNKDLKLDRNFLKVISPEELANYLRKENKISKNILAKRARGFVYSKKGIILVDNQKNKIDKVLARIGYELYNPMVSDSIGITGQTACGGIAKGRVRIVVNKDNIKNLKLGEILVSSMTPEYVPAMKKAAAIITDEGGITCHAAIVSREMKKPCIIGTKIATKALKDGDLVEVDADKGTVRILKRK